LCLCGESPAADAELNRPYKLEVVLRFSDHRDLTEILKEKVERELRDNVRAAFGDLVQVEVKRTHPRLKEIEEKGLQALTAWKDVSDTKTHFVLIDYIDNSYYEIQARQHDGLTGQASPVIRKDRTNSRDFLARKIGFLLDEDFGIVGQVTNPGDEKNVEVTLKGAGLDVPLSRWVKPGDVFALVEIVPEGGRPAARPVPFAVLQSQDTPDKNGVVKCKFFHRHPIALSRPTPGSMGFRCIKLGTTKAPLRLRLVQFGARPTTKGLIGYKVRVQRQGFGDEAGAIEKATDSEGFTGVLGKTEEFDKVAFVLIYNREKRDEILARVPVAIVDDRPIVIAINAQREPLTPLELRQRYWIGRINSRLLEDQGIFAELSQEAPRAEKLAATLQRARVIKQALEDDIENLKKERESLVEAAKDTPGAKLDLSAGDQSLKRLGEDQKSLQEFVDRLREVDEQERDPARREYKAKWEQAKALEHDMEFERALQLYEEAQKGLNDSALAKKIESLKKAWEVKSPEHKKARDFIYSAEWRDFELESLKAKIANAGQAFEACKRAGDMLTPQKLLRVAISHDTKLKKLLDDLHPDVNDDERQPHQEALSAITELGKLMKAVTQYLESQKKE
jgi:hypothetical protein